MENLALMQKYLKGINPEFAKVFVEGKDKYEPFVMGKEVKLFNYETETDYVSTESEFTPYGYLPKVEVDGSNRTLVDRVMGFDTSWTQEMYSKGVSVSYMQAKFGKYKEQLNAFKGLVTGAQKTKDKIAFDMLIESNSTILADGQTLLDPAHPYPVSTLKYGTTWSNVIMNGSVQAELGPEALRLAKKALMSHMLSDGTYATSGVSNLALVVGPELSDLGQIFCQTEKAPLGAMNDINVYKGIMKLVVSPYLSTANGGNDNMWFLVDLDAVDLRVKVSEDITKTEDMDTKSLVKSYYVHEILAAKAASNRGIVGAYTPGSAWS